MCELQSLTMYVVGSPCGCCVQSFFNEKWVPGTEPELRTRLKKATKENHVATGGKAQQALKHEIAAMEQALTHTGSSHSHGQQQQQQRGVGGDAYGAAGGAAGARFEIMALILGMQCEVLELRSRQPSDGLPVLRARVDVLVEERDGVGNDQKEADI